MENIQVMNECSSYVMQLCAVNNTPNHDVLN